MGDGKENAQNKIFCCEGRSCGPPRPQDEEVPHVGADNVDSFFFSFSL